MAENTMKAGVLVGPGEVRIMDVPVPDMAPGMMRIRVRACGVCGSDIHMWKAGKGWAGSRRNTSSWGTNSAAR